MMLSFIVTAENYKHVQMSEYNEISKELGNLK